MLPRFLSIGFWRRSRLQSEVDRDLTHYRLYKLCPLAYLRLSLNQALMTSLKVDLPNHRLLRLPKSHCQGVAVDSGRDYLMTDFARSRMSLVDLASVSAKV